MKIKVPEITWALGDTEQHTISGVTKLIRPIYYKGRRVGEIDPDVAEPLMKKLLKPTGGAQS